MARERRHPTPVEPASDYRTLIEQARYQQVMAQAMRAQLLAEREQGRLLADRQTRAVALPPSQEPVQPAHWELSNGQWIDDVGDVWQ